MHKADILCTKLVHVAFPMVRKKKKTAFSYVGLGSYAYNFDSRSKAYFIKHMFLK
jgi:hypothetical protein